MVGYNTVLEVQQFSSTLYYYFQKLTGKSDP